MQKNKLIIGLQVLGALLVMINPACAQTPHSQNEITVLENQLIEKSTVVLNNTQQVLPIQSLDKIKVASIHFNYAYAGVFDSLLNKYTRIDTFNGNDYAGIKNTNDLSDALKLYNTLIIELTEGETVNPVILGFIKTNSRLKQVIVTYFGNGTGLSGLNDVNTPLIWSARATPQSGAYVAQVVFGGIASTQKLDDNYSAKYYKGNGFLTPKTRLEYTVPEEAGINSLNLSGIDDIARQAIRERATPGCVVLVAKDGKVIFNKAYGNHIYEHGLPDKITDIFDMASVTKVSATTMEVMRLTEQDKLSLDSTIGYYIAKARTTNKNDIKVRELMLHQAGLVPFIPFYEKLKPADFSRDSSDAYPTKVADGYFLRRGYFNEVMWPEMLNSALRTRGKYVYSDLSMYFMREIVETVTSQPLNIYVQQQFYNPLGMQTAGFLPRNRFKPDQIVPTELDSYFRMTLVHGYVHDQGAAMAGGVSGHAGFFASANDLAILYQMILNGGRYGGTQYFKPQTVAMFTAKQSAVSRRGLGFDRWDPDTSLHYPSQLASPQTYGHTGYTGTCFWVDPKYNLVYIFLSNRVYPKVTDKLSQLHIRGRIQDVVYKAIEKGL